MRQDRHYQGIRGEIMLVSSPTDNNSSSQGSAGRAAPTPSCLHLHSVVTTEKGVPFRKSVPKSIETTLRQAWCKLTYFELN